MQEISCVMLLPLLNVDLQPWLPTYDCSTTAQKYCLAQPLKVVGVIKYGPADAQLPVPFLL